MQNKTQFANLAGRTKMRAMTRVAPILLFVWLQPAALSTPVHAHALLSTRPWAGGLFGVQLRAPPAVVGIAQRLRGGADESETKAAGDCMAASDDEDVGSSTEVCPPSDRVWANLHARCWC